MSNICQMNRMNLPSQPQKPNHKKPKKSSKTFNITFKPAAIARIPVPKPSDAYDSLDEETETKTNGSQLTKESEANRLSLKPNPVVTVVMPSSDHPCPSPRPSKVQTRNEFRTAVPQADPIVSLPKSRRYSMREYRKLKLDIKLGGLGSSNGPQEEAVLERQEQVKELTKSWREKNRLLQECRNRRKAEQEKANTETGLQDPRQPASLSPDQHTAAEPAIPNNGKVMPVVQLACDLETRRRARRQHAQDLERRAAERQQNRLVSQHRLAFKKSLELEQLAHRRLDELTGILTSEFAQGLQV